VLRSIPTRYATIFAVVVAIEILDLVTFVPAAAHLGIGAEGNPLARTFYLVAGPLGAAALKAAGIAIILLGMARLVRRFPNMVLPSAAVASGVGLFGVVSNVTVGLLH
jgi:hypothetical protein